MRIIFSWSMRFVNLIVYFIFIILDFSILVKSSDKFRSCTFTWWLIREHSLYYYGRLGITPFIIIMVD